MRGAVTHWLTSLPRRRLLAAWIASMSACAADESRTTAATGASGTDGVSSDDADAASSSGAAESGGVGDFGCIVDRGPNPYGDPSSTEEGPMCAQLDEGSCGESELCQRIYGRRIVGCSGDGIPECGSPTDLDFLGCVAFVGVCKNGTNYFCKADDPSTIFVTTHGCAPYGYDDCSPPAVPDPVGLPPSCGDWWWRR